MDAVHFGRWISERRRRQGWHSQRTLADTASQSTDPYVRGSGISEDFLARLEAGRLAHPFRGIVRRRVLALAWLLCKDPRDVRLYLRAAELTELTASEIEQMNRLRERLSAGTNARAILPPTTLLPTVLHLPPHPRRLLGRETTMHQLISAIIDAADIGGVCAITGMPGVGKSVLAYEALHLLTASDENEREGLHCFPQGIAAFTCTGRRGVSGLIALLNEIISTFDPAGNSKGKPTVPLPDTDLDLAGAIHRTRSALAGKRVLLLLDDVDAQFPLHLALEALLAHDLMHSGTESQGNIKHTAALHRVILTTSRYIPAPTLTTAAHFHLEPLELDAALELFSALLVRGGAFQSIGTDEARLYAQQICKVVGYLPLAIELAATAVAVKGIPLGLLAAHLTQVQQQSQGMSDLLDDGGMLRSSFDQALAALDPEMRRRFITLLATLGSRLTFDLEKAAAILRTTTAASVCPEDEEGLSDTSIAHYTTTGAYVCNISLAQLASAAADLGQFVRHSLLELEPGDPAIAYGETTGVSSHRYRLHPLLQEYSIDCLRRELESEELPATQHNALSRTLAYAGTHQQQEHTQMGREFQLSGVTHAW